MSSQADPEPVAGSQPPRVAARSSFLADLRSVLGERDFRRLYVTRLISQAGDGVFTAGLGTYVFFNATRFPNPGAAAVAFAVLYLPYSFIGPFAGVFIDRWSRRQILVYSALLRAGFVVLAAIFVASGALGAPLYGGALLVLGVNRFFLSALSAALPHVVPEDKLVMANSVAPTSGTIVAFAGGIAGATVHVITGGGQGGSAITLLCGGLCYLIAGLVATRMRRDLLGPARRPGQPASSGLIADLEAVAVGLAAGVRHIAARRKASAALLATGCHRLLYGILLLMSILLYRNYFFRASGESSALSHYTILLITSAVGYGTAALATPVVTRRLRKAAWVASLLAAGGIVTGLLGAGFRQPEFLIVGFALGVVSQGITICTTTIFQEEVDDGFLGRVFSVNDMVYNSAFVLGAVVSTAFMPDSGRSYPMLAAVAIGYLVAAAVYWLANRQSSSSGSSGAPPSPWPSAQRRSS